MHQHSPDIRFVNSFTKAWKPGLLAVILAALSSGQALAADGDSCNPNLDFSVANSGPIFLGDTIRISANLGARDIVNGSYQDIYAFGYALNCHIGESFANCTSEGNTVQFIGNLTTDCKQPNGDPVELNFPEDNIIEINTVGGPIRTGANQQCNVQFDAKIVALAPEGDNLIVQAMGWPVAGWPSTKCSNGLTSSASSTLGLVVRECDIDVQKEVSVDNVNWFAADTPETAPVLQLGGTAYYRLKVSNIGTADYVQPISVVDAALGIDTTIPALAKGKSTIVTGAQIPNLTKPGRCQVVGNLENTSSVGAFCRTGVSKITAGDTNNAWLSCAGVSSVDIEKATNGADADTPTGPQIPVGGAVTWTYVVTNNGTLPLTNVAVSDSDIGPVTCPQNTLAVGASMTCTMTGTATLGQYANLGTVNASSAGGPVTDSDPSHYFGVTTSITIEKSTNGIDADAAPGPNIAVGGAVIWTYVVTNTSNAALTSVGVTDNRGVVVTCPKNTLAAGESMECTGAPGVAVAGQYSNIGTATGTPPIGAPVTDTDPSHYFGTGAPSIIIVKEISVDAGTTWKDANNVGSAAIAVYPSDALYRFTVTNNGSAPLKDVVVNDIELGITDYPIGNLAVGQSVVITSTQEPLLHVENRCEGRGTFINTAAASGLSAETNAPVSDDDSAVLKCIGEPHITILKEISPTGSDPWFDDETPPQEYPSDAWYRISVTNDGTAPLENVEVADGDLSVLEIIGDLAVGQTVVLTSGQVSELYQENRCTGSGKVGNLASVSGNSVDDPADTVDDSDTATLVCVGTPLIDLIKEISVDNLNWFDANTEGAAVVAQAPSNAWYRITVKNTGPVGLTNVVLNDGTLGITDYAIGDIAAGQQVVLTSGQISALYYPDRCTGKGTFGNSANVVGTSSETGSQSSDSDEAWLECTGTPDIQIVKEISVNGGVTWYDGSTPSQLAPSDALYRLTVTNTGTTDLDGVVVNDAVLGIVDYPIGYLPIGGSVVLTDGEIAALFQADRCTTAGTFVNTASSSGVSLEYPYGSVNDSDSATLVCAIPVDICAISGRPSILKLSYNGTYESDNVQNFVGVPDGTGPLPFAPVTVKLYDKNELEATLYPINVGDPMNVFGSWTQSGKIPPSIKVEVLNGTQLLQSISFHGSCSLPLFVGDEFGAVTIIGYTP